MIRVDADVVFDGKDFQDRSSVIIDDGSIVHVGPTAALRPDHARLPAQHSPTVLPGLWDVHAHFFGVRELTMQAMLQTPPAVAGARAAVDAQAMLTAGITSVREAGGYGVHLAPVVDEGTLAGPDIYAAGAVIGSTGGHGDYAAAPLHWMTSEQRPPQFHLADGVDECIRAVRLQVRRGAAVIKVCASGGVLTAHDDPDQRQYSDAELRAIVDTAADAGRIVMAHATGRAAILASLEAGVRTIEHGTFLDDEVIAALIEKDAILVPTLTIGILNHDRPLSPPVRAKAERAAAAAQSSVAAAYSAGVRIAAGSDIGVFSLPGGRVTGLQEIAHLHTAGLSARDALRAATSIAALTVGDRARGDGMLQAGSPADLVATGLDPRGDLQRLAEVGAITRVWKGGLAVG